MHDSHTQEDPPTYQSSLTTLQRLLQNLQNIAPIVSTFTGAGLFTLPGYFFGTPIASETAGIALFQFGLVLFAEQFLRQVLSRARSSSLDTQIAVTAGRFAAALGAASFGFLTIVGLTQGLAGSVGPGAITALASFLGTSLGFSTPILALLAGAATLLATPAAAYLAAGGVVTAALAAVDAIPTALSWAGRMIGQGFREIVRPFFRRARPHKD